jgi:hypothetical protein
VGVIVGGAIYGVLGVVEVTREDSVNRMVVVSEGIKFSKPKLTVRTMKVDVNKAEGFTC